MQFAHVKDARQACDSMASQKARGFARRAQIAFDFAQDRLSLAKNGKLHHYLELTYRQAWSDDRVFGRLVVTRFSRG
jgi:hypothetical protein